MRIILSRHIKIVALSVLFSIGILSVAGTFFALRVTTNYSMDQFLPKKHSLLTWDQESKKLFHIFEASPYIVLLSLDKSSKTFWYSGVEIGRLQKLTDDIAALPGVRNVVSLGNIQSSFEQKNEFERLAEGFAEAFAKWPTGSYLLWYPVKSRRATEALARDVAAAVGAGPSPGKCLRLEFSVAPQQAGAQLASAGLLMVNPPYTLAGELKAILPELEKPLGQGGAGRFRLETPKP